MSINTIFNNSKVLNEIQNLINQTIDNSGSLVVADLSNNDGFLTLSASSGFVDINMTPSYIYSNLISSDSSIDISYSSITGLTDLVIGDASGLVVNGLATFKGGVNLVCDVSGSVAVDFDMIDNNASALSFDCTGKAGILELVTTNSAEAVNMSGLLNVTGLTSLAGVLSLSNDISGCVAIDFDLIDNNASALSFDTTGKAGILELVTTNSAEAVNMSGLLNVTGLTSLAGVLSLSNDISGCVAIDFDLIDNNASALSFDTTGKAGVLELVTTNSAEAVNMSGLLAVTGLATFTAGCSTGPTAGYKYSGSLSNSAAGSTVVLASKVGRCTFTGVDIAGSATQAFTITNSSAGTGGLVNFTCTSAVDLVSLYIVSAVWTQNTNIVVTIQNSSVATATGASTFDIDFISFN